MVLTFLESLCLCADSCKPGNGDPAPGAEDYDRTAFERESTAETERLDAGQFLYASFYFLNN